MKRLTRKQIEKIVAEFPQVVVSNQGGREWVIRNRFIRGQRDTFWTRYTDADKLKQACAALVVAPKVLQAEQDKCWELAAEAIAYAEQAVLKLRQGDHDFELKYNNPITEARSLQQRARRIRDYLSQ